MKVPVDYGRTPQCSVDYQNAVARDGENIDRAKELTGSLPLTTDHRLKYA
jgi:hypothetical protein